MAGELCLGDDYSVPDSREACAEIWDMAKTMKDAISIDALHSHLMGRKPQLGDIFLRIGPGRRPANDVASGRLLIMASIGQTTLADSQAAGRKTILDS